MQGKKLMRDALVYQVRDEFCAGDADVLVVSLVGSSKLGNTSVEGKGMKRKKVNEKEKG